MRKIRTYVVTMIIKRGTRRDEKIQDVIHNSQTLVHEI